MSRSQRVAVITGASSGIGRATALRFADAGWSVVLASRRGPALTELAEECTARGGRATAVPTDVTVHAEVQALADAAVAAYGRIDVWVNNAAVSVFAPSSRCRSTTSGGCSMSTSSATSTAPAQLSRS
ncbi:hypothetical protein GCM10025866_11200 [Naasia aerilata]|uniref:Short subunit dehydrogenase n=1 Tax=Naasia aerilata TaxID=1162966 RepID=A0ABM8GAH3_9MICO|nr:hypothetical protein GCM10025866_11200 [Naasia aerilata]